MPTESLLDSFLREFREKQKQDWRRGERDLYEYKPPTTAGRATTPSLFSTMLENYQLGQSASAPSAPSTSSESLYRPAARTYQTGYAQELAERKNWNDTKPIAPGVNLNREDIRIASQYKTQDIPTQSEQNYRTQKAEKSALSGFAELERQYDPTQAPADYSGAWAKSAEKWGNMTASPYIMTDVARGFTTPDLNSNNVMERFGASLRAGTGDLIESAGNVFKMSGDNTQGSAFAELERQYAPNAPRETTNATRLGEWLQQKGQETRKGYELPQVPFGHGEGMLDPDFWTNTVGRQVPNTAAFIAPGMAGARVGIGIAEGMGIANPVLRTFMGAAGASAVNTPLEAGMEAGDVYRQLIAQNVPQEQAFQTAMDVARKNAAVLGVSNLVEFGAPFLPKALGKAGMMPKALTDTAIGRGAATAGGIGLSGQMEGLQEGLQSGISQQALGDPNVSLNPLEWNEEQWESYAVGNIMGTAFGVGAHVAQQPGSNNQPIKNIQNNFLNQLPPEVKTHVQDYVAEEVKAGRKEEEALAEALEEVAGTPEGQEILQNVAGKFGQKEQQRQEVEAQGNVKVPPTAQDVRDMQEQVSEWKKNDGVRFIDEDGNERTGRVVSVLSNGTAQVLYDDPLLYRNTEILPLSELQRDGVREPINLQPEASVDRKAVSLEKVAKAKTLTTGQKTAITDILNQDDREIHSIQQERQLGLTEVNFHNPDGRGSGYTVDSYIVQPNGDVMPNTSGLGYLQKDLREIVRFGKDSVAGKFDTVKERTIAKRTLKTRRALMDAVAEVRKQKAPETVTELPQTPAEPIQEKTPEPKQPEQKPAASKMDLQVGDRVTIKGRQGEYEVTDVSDRGAVKVRMPNGQEVPVGRGVVTKVEQPEISVDYDEDTRDLTINGDISPLETEEDVKQALRDYMNEQKTVTESPQSEPDKPHLNGDVDYSGDQIILRFDKANSDMSDWLRKRGFKLHNEKGNKYWYADKSHSTLGTVEELTGRDLSQEKADWYNAEMLRTTGKPAPAPYQPKEKEPIQLTDDQLQEALTAIAKYPNMSAHNAITRHLGNRPDYDTMKALTDTLRERGWITESNSGHAQVTDAGREQIGDMEEGVEAPREKIDSIEGPYAEEVKKIPHTRLRQALKDASEAGDTELENALRQEYIRRVKNGVDPTSFTPKSEKKTMKELREERKEEKDATETEKKPDAKTSDPWAMSLSDFMANDGWKAVNAGNEGQKTAHYMVMPDGKKWHHGSWVHGRDPKAAKKNFHHEQVYWKLRIGFDEITQAAAYSHSDLKQDYDNAKRIRKEIVSVEGENIRFRVGPKQQKTYRITDFPKDIVAARGFVRDFNLLVPFDSGWKKGSWDFSELLIGAVYDEVRKALPFKKGDTVEAYVRGEWRKGTIYSVDTSGYAVTLDQPLNDHSLFGAVFGDVREVGSNKEPVTTYQPEPEKEPIEHAFKVGDRISWIEEWKKPTGKKVTRTTREDGTIIELDDEGYIVNAPSFDDHQPILVRFDQKGLQLANTSPNERKGTSQPVSEDSAPDVPAKPKSAKEKAIADIIESFQNYVWKDLDQFLRRMPEHDPKTYRTANLTKEEYEALWEKHGRSYLDKPKKNAFEIGNAISEFFGEAENEQKDTSQPVSGEEGTSRSTEEMTPEEALNDKTLLKKLFFAVQPGENAQIEAIREKKPNSLLFSFAYWKGHDIKKDFLDKIGYRPKNIVVDSGAFTFEQKGISSGMFDVMDTYEGDYSMTREQAAAQILEEARGGYGGTLFHDYIAFLDEQKDNYDYVMTLDSWDKAKGSEGSYADKTQYAYELMKLMDLNPIPVYHYGHDPKQLDFYLNDGADYIALGKSAKGLSKTERIDWVNSLIQKHPDVKFHLLGAQDKYIFDRTPGLYSADGTSWIRNAGLDSRKSFPDQTRAQKAAENIDRMRKSAEPENDVQKEIKDVQQLMDKRVKSLAKELKDAHGTSDLRKEVAKRGGLRAGQLKEEYKQLPLGLKNNKTGKPLDEMADELGMTERELIDGLMNRPDKIDYEARARRMLETDDAEYKALQETLSILQEGQEPTAPSQASETTATTPINKLVERYADQIRKAELPKGKAVQKALRDIANKEMGRTATEDEWSDALETAVQIVAAERSKGKPLTEKIKIGQELEGYLKNAGRSLEKMKHQQYSTPVPLAAIATHVADVRQGETVKEGSAGTGSLLMPFREGDYTVKAVELSERRADILRGLGFDVTNDDTFNVNVKADVAIGNPPFKGANLAKGTKQLAFNPPWKGSQGDLGNRFLLWDLRSLPEGGRLVYIVSPGVIDNQQNSPFRQWLKENHTVRAMIKFPEGVYDSRGTTFGAGLIVVDKGKIADAPPAITGTPKTLDEMIELVKPLTEGGSHERKMDGARRTRDNTQNPASADATATLGRGTQRQGASTPESGGSATTSGNGGAKAGTSRSSRGRMDSVADEGTAGANDGVDAGRTADVVEPERGEAGSGDNATTGTEPKSARSGNAKQSERNGDAAVSGFVGYVPRKRLTGRKHLGNVTEAPNLQYVSLPQEMFDDKYDPHPRVQNGGPKAVKKLSDVQLEAVVAAKYNHAKGKRGILIADDTGMGKTAEQLGIIADAWHSGRTKRILVITTKDQVAESSFIGENQEFDFGIPFTFVNPKTHENFKDDVFKNKPDEWTPLPDEDGAIVMSKYTFSAAQKAVWEWLDGTKNDVMVMIDESHDFKSVDDANMAIAAKELYADFKEKGQFIYASATASEDITGLEHLYGLGIWDTGTFGDFRMRLQGMEPSKSSGGQKSKNKLGRSLNKGSAFSREIPLSMMEQIVRELKSEGQYIGRALSMEGVDMVPIPIGLSAKDKGDWNRAVAFIQKIAAKAEEHGNKPTDRGKIMSQVVGYMRRLRSYYVMKGIIANIEEHQKAGTLKRFALSGFYKGGDEGKSASLAAAINAINEKKKTSDDDGETTFVTIPEAQFDKAELMAILNGENPEWGEAPVPELPSPIELLNQAFGEDKVLVISGDVPTKERKQVVKSFQTGEKPIVFFTGAGNTGINLHDTIGERIGFYPVDYPYEAKAMKQTEGRVNRTGQKTAPIYFYPYTDSSVDTKFVGTLLTRYQSMGALSRGDAVSMGGEALGDFDLSGEVAKLAIYRIVPRLDPDVRAQMFGEYTRDMFNNFEANEIATMESEVRELFRGDVDVKKFLNALMFLEFDKGNEVFKQYAEAIAETEERLADQGGVRDKFETYGGKQLEVMEAASGIKLRRIQTQLTDQQKKRLEVKEEQARKRLTQAEADVESAIEAAIEAMEANVAKGETKVAEALEKANEAKTKYQDLQDKIRFKWNEMSGPERLKAQDDRNKAQKKEQELLSQYATHKNTLNDLKKKLKGAKERDKDTLTQMASIRRQQAKLENRERVVQAIENEKQMSDVVLLVDGKFATNGKMVTLRTAILKAARNIFGENIPASVANIELRGYTLENGEKFGGAIIPKFAEHAVLAALEARARYDGELDVEAIKQGLMGGTNLPLEGGYELRYMPNVQKFVIWGMNATKPADLKLYEQLKGKGIGFDAKRRAFTIDDNEGFETFLKRFPPTNGEIAATSETEGKSLRELRQEARKNVEDAAKDQGTDLHAGIPFGKFFGVRKSPAPTGANTQATFDDPDSEKRFTDAGNAILSQTFADRVKGRLTELKQRATRQYEHLPRGAEFEPLRYALSKLEKQRPIAADDVLSLLENITHQLTKAQFNTYRRKVILDDMQEEADAGNPLAFGFTPASLAKEKAKFDALAAADPMITAMIQLREQTWDSIKNHYISEMAKIGVDVSHQLQRKNYFRHQIIEHAQERIRGTGKELKTPKNRGWLKTRKGSDKDYSTDYLAAEAEVMIDMVFSSEMAKTIQLVDKKYNIKRDLQKEAKQQGLKGRNAWKQLIPRGYTIWQPDEGNIFYKLNPMQVAMEQTEKHLKNMGLNQQQIDAVLDLMPDNDNDVLVMGGKKMEYVVKEEVAATLKDLMQDKNRGWFHSLNKSLMDMMKQQLLIGPSKVIKYNLRNTFSDMDKLIAGNPDSFKYLYQASKELHGLYYRKGKMSPELDDWFHLGGIQSLLQVNEMGDLRNLEMFMRLYEMKDRPNIKNVMANAVYKYWKEARRATDFRESIFRYASYLSYLDQLKKNNGTPNNYGASRRDEVDALDNNKDKAFKLSSELLIDYSQTSALGQEIRATKIPFYSFIEGNMKSYVQIIKNLSYNEVTATAVGKTILRRTGVMAPYYAYVVGRRAIQLGGLMIALQVWNSLVFGDEEDDLPEEVKRNIHIVLGRDDQGNVLYLDRLGAFEEMLSWFGMDNAWSEAQDILNNRRTFAETAIENAKGVVSKGVNSVNAIYKGLGEQIVGRQLFPDAFSPRVIRDRWDHLTTMFGADKLYESVRHELLGDKPHAPFKWSSLASVSSRPEEGAYYEVLDLKRRFMEKQGKKSSEVTNVSPQSQALYNYKQALKFGDKTAQRRFLKEYAMLTKDPSKVSQGLERSLMALDPLSGLNEREKMQFIASLTPEEREKYRVANRFFQTTLLGRKPIK